MSRIGKKPVPIPSGVTVNVSAGIIKVKGPKGELSFAFHPNVQVSAENFEVKVTRKSDEKFDKSLHGLTRKLIANMVEGVTQGFSKKLEIQGVGFRAQLQGKKLALSLGFSHPVEYTPPEGINIAIDQEKKNILIISGIDKQLVGQASAVIRSFKKPDPYKGKGIRYLGEKIVRKAGKAAAATGAGVGGAAKE